MPWNLLLKRFGLMFAGMVVLVALTGRSNMGGLLGGLLLGGLLFFGFSWLLSKFGYAPKTMAQIRGEAAQRNAERGTEPRPARRRRGTAQALTNATGRPKPPPTRRTASGVGRHPQPRKR